MEPPQTRTPGRSERQKPEAHEQRELRELRPNHTETRSPKNQTPTSPWRVGTREVPLNKEPRSPEKLRKKDPGPRHTQKVPGQDQQTGLRRNECGTPTCPLSRAKEREEDPGPRTQQISPETVTHQNKNPKSTTREPREKSKRERTPLHQSQKGAGTQKKPAPTTPRTPSRPHEKNWEPSTK